jgi:CheY-like chemotaxis protein
MSGAEVAAGLRRDPRTVDIPIVVLTGGGGDPRLDVSGVVGWVEKPIETTKLLDAIHHASGRREGCQVLIVEDDEDVGRVISEMMEERGIRTCMARSGREAIELSNRLSYDLLLLDPGLPEIDGFGIIEWLRHLARYRSLPVIVYSARDFSESERDRLRLGHTEFLVKTKTPIDELGRRIYNLLEGSRSASTAGVP